jgi:hypothetical protein
MKNTWIVTIITLLFCAFSLSLQTKAAEPIIYSPYVADDFPKNVYWGDTHLHTSLSFDAYGDGNTRLGADAAYDFARGKVIEGHDGLPVRMSRPLDFIVIADHAEYMGVVQGVNTANKLLQATEPGARWTKMAQEGGLLQVYGEMVNDGATNQPRQLSEEFTRSVWSQVIDYAEQYNDPGVFTTFIGYEYSSLPDGGDNLHRVVMFRDGADRTSQVVPFSLFDGENPEQLWEYFAQYEKKTGGQVFSIPHNGNLSAGRMFALKDLDGKPLTAEYAEKRMRWEPLVETTQMKGDSETHAALSPDDEFANFETWDLGNLIVTKRTSPELMQFEYSRSALKHGLAQGEILGKNPVKFGMIGATDAHTSFSSAEEDNFLGKYATASPSPDRWSKKFPPLTVPGVLEQFTEWQTSQSGYAAVWSKENTREAIFDAMKRKEVYATTGPRMTVRTFGGFDFSREDAHSNSFVRIGYQKGVPMGGDLSAAPRGKKFSMIVAAAKDPDGANLDRIQVIKGWVDSNGGMHERVYDAAVSDGRKIGEDGRCKTPVGTTVDLTTATYKNTIGDAVLTSTWVDPDFDPAVSSFYYARVIEIPTPRWTAFDAVRYNIEMPEEVTMVLQERAYTSPIWYTPEKMSY